MREVLPCPEPLPPLPCPAQGLVGCIEVRGVMLPVLDVCALLGPISPASHERIIIVLRWQSRLLGILVGQVEGMARIDQQALMRLQRPGGSQTRALVSHLFEYEGHSVSVLDPAKIAELPDVPWVDEPQREPEPSPSEGDILETPLSLASHQSQHQESILLFHCAGRQLGVSALDVHATVPRCAILASPLRGGICQGVIQHHGRQVPVVNTLALLNLGQLPQVNEAALLILRFPDQGLVGLMIDGVSDILRIAPSQTLPMPRLAVPQAAWFRFAIDLRAWSMAGLSEAHPNGPQAMVLNVPALQQKSHLAGLASLSSKALCATPLDRRASPFRNEGTRSGRPSRRPFLRFQFSGQDFACPLDQISEILPFKARELARTSTDAQVLGMMAHRGKTLTVMCLATVLESQPPNEAGRAHILVVNTRHEAVGFCVESLRAIASGHRLAGPQTSSPSSTLPAIAYAKSLVELDLEGGLDCVPSMDLVQLAETLLSRAEQNQAAPDLAPAS